MGALKNFETWCSAIKSTNSLTSAIIINGMINAWLKKQYTRPNTRNRLVRNTKKPNIFEKGFCCFDVLEAQRMR